MGLQAITGIIMILIMASESKRCEDPPAPPANGTLSYRNDAKTAVKYDCDLEYKLAGNEYSHCQHTGNWSNPAPSCVHECPNAPVPLNNGDFTYVSWGDLTIWYRCNVGYRLVGESSSICFDRVWNNPEPPTCVLCKDPPAPPANGTLSYLDDDKTAVKYDCDLEYRLEGQKYSSCEDTGDWNNRAPSCVHECPNAPVPLNNGDFTYVSWGDLTIWYRCNVGYRLVGESSSICFDRVWNNPEPPTCVLCKDPPAPPANGALSYLDDNKIDVKYDCDLGYKAEGNEHSSCRYTGDWDNRAPSCVPV